MVERNILKQKLCRSFSLYDDLLFDLKEESLVLDLAGLPSNTIGQQLWCVIGARQSYLKAILKDGWQGFSCGLRSSETSNKSAVQRELESSWKSFLADLEKITSLSQTQQSLLLDLMEHEAQHHGQLIRYLYAQKLQIPKTWQSRYSLSEIKGKKVE